MSRGFGGPLQYVQGPGELNNLAKYTTDYGSHVLVLIDAFLFPSISARLEESFRQTESKLLCISGEGECSWKEINRVIDVSKEFQPEVIVGVGGGKTMDTAKMVAEQLSLPKIICPTSASSDAPTSALSVMYSDEGEHMGSIMLKKHAEMVLLDTDIIISAPPRLFVSGMGDALATYFEAHAILDSDTPNHIGSGYKPTRLAAAIADLCYDILLEKGEFALECVKQGILTSAVEDVIEANTLLSGLGFENTGCVTAHGVHSGLTILPETAPFFHGEKVAFGTVVELVLENRFQQEIDKIMRFMVSVGLPVTLEQFNVAPTEENIEAIAAKSLKSNLVTLEPFEVNMKNLVAAIKGANVLGKKYLEAAK